jgi:hypothetical protein
MDSCCCENMPSSVSEPQPFSTSKWIIARRYWQRLFIIFLRDIYISCIQLGLIHNGSSYLSILPPSSGLKFTSFYETLVSARKSTRRYNPEDQHLYLHRRENFRSRITFKCTAHIGVYFPLHWYLRAVLLCWRSCRFSRRVVYSAFHIIAVSLLSFWSPYLCTLCWKCVRWTHYGRLNCLFVCPAVCPHVSTPMLLTYSD